MAAITYDERKTNERPGVRAQHRYARMSAYKARQVLDLIRGLPVGEARNLLQLSERSAARTIAKVLDSAVANAANNNDIPPDELFVAACYADEGPTLKRWRPRARGRATRIRKRTCHITVIVGRYSPEELDRMRARLAEKGRATTDAAAARARRVARSRAKQAEQEAESEETEATTDEAAEATQAEATEEVTEGTFAEDAEASADEATTDEATDEASAEEAAADGAEEAEAAAEDGAAAGDDAGEDTETGKDD
ncbi:MAG: 50S ribosomal protein L22 [Propioniciclava sp.]|nr:50S ribosomal protein L22 [Propioniciclava sp.]